MDIYLPIAETSVNPFVFLGLSAAIGVLSGLLGVGGGFLMTPALIFAGIPPSVAVASEANHVIGTSVSAGIVHARHRHIDFVMVMVILVGGILGSWSGVQIFAQLRQAGIVDTVIYLLNAFFLIGIGTLMMLESVRRLFKKTASPKRLYRSRILIALRHSLPMKMRFRRSHLYISPLLPLLIGFVVGMLSAMTGVGGGFILVPALIYLLGMPTSLVIGTSLLYIAAVSASVTIFHATINHTVDAVLALILLSGGVIGAQFGSRAITYLRGSQLRAMMAVLALLAGGRLIFHMASLPSSPYLLTWYPL